jgi:hypothetical protein
MKRSTSSYIVAATAALATLAAGQTPGLLTAPPPTPEVTAQELWGNALSRPGVRSRECWGHRASGVAADGGCDVPPLGVPRRVLYIADPVACAGDGA